MHVEYNASRAIAILVTTALLFNAMMPTLAHAATYLQGTEVNANTLVQDAYVQVIYRDRNDEQKLAKGWIDAVSETTFTIRSGALFGKKTIAYDKVVSVIMSDESTAPVKQMNEVNRFIREMQTREIKQSEKEVKTEDRTDQKSDKSRADKKELKTEQTVKSEANTEAIQRLNQTEYVVPWFINDTRTVTVMARGQIDPSKITAGWYAYVVCTSTEGAKKTETGQIVNKDATHIFVKDRIDRITTWTIAYDDIDTLVVAKQWQDMERYRETGARYNTKVRFKASSISKRWRIGRLVTVKLDTLIIQRGSRFYQLSHSSISNLEVSIGLHRNTGKGLTIGAGLGLGIIALGIWDIQKADDTRYLDGGTARDRAQLVFLFGALPASILSILTGTIIGAISKSDKWVGVPPQRLNLSVAPPSAKGLRAALTFNF